MLSSIVARETEIHHLDILMEEDLPQFVAVYGRRRVGKTFLIREYFNDEFTFFHTAISPRKLKDRQSELLYRIQLDECFTGIGGLPCAACPSGGQPRRQQQGRQRPTQHH